MKSTHFTALLLIEFFARAALAEAAPTETQAEDWSVHFQTTVLSQSHGGFNSPYSGSLSLSGDGELKTSVTSTLFLGRRLWRGAEIYFNPEVSAGSGFSDTHGVAGFPNGEIYRVDVPTPRFNLSRLLVQQDFALSTQTERFEAGKNQLAEERPSRRLTVIAGKFSLNDYFDNNLYSHDPRTQFMNWALMDNGAWDYAADTRGYTLGVLVEYNQAEWALRFSRVLVPTTANGIEFDTRYGEAHGDNLELEVREQIQGRPGRIRILAYNNRANMGSYRDALAAGNVSSSAPDITTARRFSNKSGFGLNLEQAVCPDWGVFARVGWNDGTTESWAFTEIDRAYSLGAELKGRPWSRPDDRAGAALMINALSPDHADYLRAGGLGFIVGDGQLNYAPEQIAEVYYQAQLWKYFALALDFQGIAHPAYNADRGPVAVVSARAHLEF